jgi:hypothetical protein
MIRFQLSERLIRTLRRHMAKATHREPFELQHDAIMLTGDFGGLVFLTMDGYIFAEDWDLADVEAMRHPALPRKVTEPLEAHAALVIAAERIPELAELLPKRPPRYLDCQRCEGTGWFRLGSEIRIVCERCGGLGWLAA